MKPHSIRLLTFSAIYFLGAGTSAWAQGIPGHGAIEDYDPREVAMLPRYCIHTQLFRDRVPGGNNQSEIKRWYKLIGPTFHAMHHYCWGLMKTNRAVLHARTKQARDFHLRASIGEFDYVLDRAPEDFALRPEILTRKGENLLRLGNAQVGTAVLQQALQLKPDYWPPYAAMSDYLKQSGDLRLARGWLERGLTEAPDSTALKKRLAALDATSSKANSSSPVPRKSK